MAGFGYPFCKCIAEPINKQDIEYIKQLTKEENKYIVMGNQVMIISPRPFNQNEINCLFNYGLEFIDRTNKFLAHPCRALKIDHNGYPIPIEQ